MSQKMVYVPELGELILSKRKGSKNIRLSIASDGRVRVGLPAWVPYAAGISFAKSRAEWIDKHRGQNQIRPLQNGDRIGKSYRLVYNFQEHSLKTTTRLALGSVKITSGLPLSDTSVQAQAVKASERALKKEAQRLLPQRLSQLAQDNGYSFSRIRIKKMTSRWGSCSSDKTITLNYFLIQLPWQLIDYVLIHELVHTTHLNHSRQFWHDFDKTLPGAKQKRKQLQSHKPVINSVGLGMA